MGSGTFPGSVELMTERRKFFTVKRAADIIGGEYFPASAGSERLSDKFKADSRLAEPGDVFIAMRGSGDDGHNYIGKAVEAGARCIVLERDYFDRHKKELAEFDAIFLPVDGTAVSVARLAKNWLSLVSPKVIGITGSVGKTTTKDL